MADPAEETVEQTPDPDSPRGLRKQIDEANARAREAEEKAKAAEADQRELALHRAGLASLNETQREALFLTHKGEQSAEAIQATAKALFGVVPANGASTATPAQTDETNEALGQMATFAAGGTSVEPPPPAKEAFVKQVQEFPGSREELFSLIFEQNAHLLDS